MVLGLSAIAVAWSGSWYGFSRFGYLIDPLFPSMVAALIYVSSSLISFLRTEADKRFIRSAFGRYMSPVLVETARERSKAPAARRRDARTDHTVFGYPRLHQDLGIAEPSGLDAADQQLPHADDLGHPKPERIHRQIYRRLHRRLLECAAGRSLPCAQRRAHGAADA